MPVSDELLLPQAVPLTATAAARTALMTLAWPSINFLLIIFFLPCKPARRGFSIRARAGTPADPGRYSFGYTSFGFFVVLMIHLSKIIRNEGSTNSTHIMEISAPRDIRTHMELTMSMSE